MEPCRSESVSNCRCLRVRSDGTGELDPYGSVFLWEPELTVLTCRLAPSCWHWVLCPEPGLRRWLGGGRGLSWSGLSSNPSRCISTQRHVWCSHWVSAQPWCPVQHSTPPGLPAGQVWAPRAAWELGTPSERCSFCVCALRPERS